MTLEHVKGAIDKLVNQLIKQQQENGSWNYCFESGTMTDAYMLLLMQILTIKDKKLEDALVERILNKQAKKGVWKLYADEKGGNLSATIESCLALLYTGVKRPDDPAMVKANQLISSKGGVQQASSLTKAVLALLGHLKWSKRLRIPITFLLLPPQSPIHFFDLVGYARVHIAPILLTVDRNFNIRLPRKKRVSTWLQAMPPINSPLQNLRHHEDREAFLLDLQRHLPWPTPPLHQQAVEWGKQFLLQRIENDGTLYSYFSSTFFLIVALLALGYDIHHPVIQKAVQGLYGLVYPMKKGVHVQETTSTVWDTALILYALQEAGVDHQHAVIQHGLDYILKKQHVKVGDWILRNPKALPGGWGFSDSNTINPDVDDTTACLRALGPSLPRNQRVWKRGVDWVLSMQNRDGGWSAFEKNTDKRWTRFLTYIEGSSYLADPSTADLTGRTLEWIGQQLHWNLDHPSVRKACAWLLRHQERDGSWFGRWGISYIYGTWAALTGLAAVGMKRDDPMVRKGIDWLLSIQNTDGGWGESCSSDRKKSYIPLGVSTSTQTAWALDALIAFHERPTSQMNQGIRRLLSLLEQNGWVSEYPTGAGLAGQFYIYYHSYQLIWPLVTLAHYQQKYSC